jgi:hypothetical protein
MEVWRVAQIMNTNSINTKGFSSKESEASYRSGFAADAIARGFYENGRQCGGCSFYAPFNEDYGLCCFQKSAHFTETVLEHFTCAAHVSEDWGPHSFSENSEFHCRCGGEEIVHDKEN